MLTGGRVYAGFQRNLERFFGSVDQDGNGEIEQVEATKVDRVHNCTILLSLHNLSPLLLLSRAPSG